MPVIPQKEAGCLIEPPVSVPVAKAHKFAFTAAAEPPEDPPEHLRGLIGLLTFNMKEYRFLHNSLDKYPQPEEYFQIHPFQNCNIERMGLFNFVYEAVFEK